MQSDEHPKSRLDDDILQGRADFLKAVQAKQHLDSEPEPSDEHAAPSEEALEANNQDTPSPDKDIQDALNETAGQLDEKIQQIDALEETNKQLKDTLDQSTLSVETKQKQIDELERQLAEKISELANLKNQVEEYAELIETLQDAQSRLDELDSEPAIDQTDALYAQPLEPYCEPTDEVISEDDVHLEQKLNAGDIPTFNLADQIMADQRNASAARRGRPQSRQTSSKSGSIEHVMRQYISDAESPKPPAEDPSPPKSRQAGHTDRLLRWQDECLSDYQQTLLGSIVQKDIQRFCGQNVSFASLPHAMGN